VSFLIQKGLNVNIPDKYGGIPLGEALFHRNYSTAKLLIESGSDVNKKGLSDMTPLHYACNAGADADTVLELLKKGADPNRKTGGYLKDTALHQAAEYGLTEVVKYLLDYGADMEIKDGNGDTALCRAVRHGHFYIVKLLVRKGARFSYDQEKGFSAIQYAIANDLSEIVEYLLDQLKTKEKLSMDIMEHIDNQLILAAKADNWSKVFTWLEKEADVNYRDEKGRTALFYAVEHGNSSIVQLLLQRGADLTIKDKDGKKPVDVIRADEDNNIKNLLENPVTLLAEVEQFARHLRGRVPDTEIRKAVEILKKNETLFPCVSEKELKKLKTIKTEDMKELVIRIEKARKDVLYTHGTCSYCGRKTLKALDREVLHGNPSSPASDTEVMFHCQCLSCSHNDNVCV
jgi:ankyrin repeat protein